MWDLLRSIEGSECQQLLDNDSDRTRANSELETNKTYRKLDSPVCIPWAYEFWIGLERTSGRIDRPG